MKLYTYLDTLQTRAFYVDTDSFLYIQLSDDAQLVITGDRLGDMTSELKLCEYISAYVTGCPKITRTERTIQRRMRRQPCVRCGVLH